MNFKKQLPEWNNPGTKPPQTKINEGWLPDDRPPADWWNWKDNLTFEALKELQENAVHKGEVTTKEPTFNAGAQTVNAAIKSPVNVKRIDGKTIANPVPLFDSGALLNKYSGATIEAPNRLRSVGGSSFGYSGGFKIPVKPNTKYTLLMDVQVVSGGDYFFIRSNEESTNILAGSYVGFGNNGATFTTKADTQYIHLIFSQNATPSEIVYSNVRIVEGTQAQPFVADVKGLTNPTIANETNGTSLVVPTTLYDGEYVEQNAKGELVKYKKFQEVTLNGTENYILHYRGTTHANVRIDNFTPGIKPGTRTLVKYNGTILQKNTTMGQDTTADKVYDPTNDNTGTLFIGIANADSGWGPNYYPTPEEMKAFMLGWTMYHVESGNYNTPYNGTGTKAWVSTAYKTGMPGVENNNTTVLPTVKPNAAQIGAWKPYRLIYELATPVQEVIQPYSGLTLEKGENSVKVYAGRIVNEHVKPSKSTLADVWLINDLDYPNSFTRYKVNTTNRISRNSTIDTTWELRNTNAYGNERRVSNGYTHDTTASYTVDYEPLYTWEVTAPIDNVQLQYFETLVAVTNELVHDVAKQQDTVKRMLENVVNEEQGIQWIAPTLLNGWVNYGSGFAAAGYTKDNMGYVHLKGFIKAGSVTFAVPLLILPKGYRPKERLSFTTTSSDNAVAKVLALNLGNTGSLVLASESHNGWLSLDGITFKAEL